VRAASAAGAVAGAGRDAGASFAHVRKGAMTRVTTKQVAASDAMRLAMSSIPCEPATHSAHGQFLSDDTRVAWRVAAEFGPLLCAVQIR
jgi:hypothetical protein